jgi:DUF1680 family protein
MIKPLGNGKPSLVASLVVDISHHLVHTAEYYAVHKTLAGLLDIWRLTNDTTSRDILLSLASWVDKRTELRKF